VVAGHFAFADVSQWEPLLGRSLADHLAGARYQEFAAALGTIGCWLLTFGWVSRRFERQADTFAVRHMTQMRAAQSAAVAAGAWDAGPMGGDQAIGIDDGPPHHAPRIDDESVAIMTEALGHVALLNHIGLRKRSWRHGSIHHRQTYLRSLAGHRCDRLAIDREVLCIKLASAALIVIVIAALTVI
jgi:Zn-dependent protease with chaperone function